jgi:two-component system LytT family sensor kinase
MQCPIARSSTRDARLQQAVDSLQSCPWPVHFPSVFFYDGCMIATSTVSSNANADTDANAPAGRWHRVTAAWLALALFDATQTVVSMHAMGMHHAWVALFFVTMASWAVWGLATPLVLGLLARFALPSFRVLPWIVHAAACLAIDAAWAGWSAFLEHSTNSYAYAGGAAPFALLWRSAFLGNLVGAIILYGAIAALRSTFEARHRLLQQQALLAEAQLAALRLQLEPHFIFNALNAVTGLIREQKDTEAVAVVAALGDLLRRVTDRSERQFTTVEDEVEFIRKYLDIQQRRFGQRLRYRIEIPASLSKAQVPDFIVQPLVENAIKHGIAKRAKGGELTLSAARSGTGLLICIANDGPPLPDLVREGVGLSNTRRRLAALYGQAQSLTLQNNADGGVLATISVPYREEAA